MREEELKEGISRRRNFFIFVVWTSEKWTASDHDNNDTKIQLGFFLNGIDFLRIKLNSFSDNILIKILYYFLFIVFFIISFNRYVKNFISHRVRRFYRSFYFRESGIKKRSENLNQENEVGKVCGHTWVPNHFSPYDRMIRNSFLPSMRYKCIVFYEIS